MRSSYAFNRKDAVHIPASSKCDAISLTSGRAEILLAMNSLTGHDVHGCLALRTKVIRVVRSDWLIELNDSYNGGESIGRGKMPPRQEAPPEAFHPPEHAVKMWKKSQEMMKQNPKRHSLNLWLHAIS